MPKFLLWCTIGSSRPSLKEQFTMTGTQSKRAAYHFTLLLLVLWAVLPSTVNALECHVDTSADNTVRFVSDAPIEDFDGVTNRIDGFVVWSGSTLDTSAQFEGSEFYFEVPLDALDTGVDLRNSHMRENYLHTDRFPYASFSGHIEGVAHDTSGGIRVVTQGVFSIHGVEKDQDIACLVSANESGYRVQASFPVSLTDHDIEIPSLMFLKINEIVELELDFYLKVVSEAHD
jgi:hypothetical protein